MKRVMVGSRTRALAAALTIAVGATGCSGGGSTRAAGTHRSATSNSVESTSTTALTVASSYLLIASDGVDFIQWTREGDTLTGSLQVVESNGKAPPNEATTPSSDAVSGSVHGATVTVQIDGGVPLFGSLSSGALRLSIPQKNGTIQTGTFQPATVDDYNRSVATFQASIDAANSAEMQAEQDAAAARQAQQDAAAKQAQQAAQARRGAYAAACKAHGGYIDSSNQGCYVDYPPQMQNAVAINSDGTWNQGAADMAKSGCDQWIATAQQNAASGYPFKVPPQYHPDTGVCFDGVPG